MTRLSVKALRLYDQQGLLQPAEVDASTGYRYYHLSQVKQAEIIRVLRAVDMPLDNIQLILESDNDEAISEHLLHHKTRLTDQLSAQQRMLDYLETIIKHKAFVMSYQIAIAEQNPQLVATVRFLTNISKIAADISTGFGKLVAGLSRAGVTPSGMPMILHHDVIDAESGGEVEIAIPIGQSIADDGDVRARTLEGGTMATTIHQGAYTAITPAYHSLTKWISENGYQIVGAPREVYLNDPQVVPETELLTRVEFPVCSVENTAN